MAAAFLRAMETTEIWQFLHVASRDVNGIVACCLAVYQVVAAQAFRASASPQSQARYADRSQESDRRMTCETINELGLVCSVESDSYKENVMVIDTCSFCGDDSWVVWWRDIGGAPLHHCVRKCVGPLKDQSDEHHV